MTVPHLPEPLAAELPLAELPVPAPPVTEVPVTGAPDSDTASALGHLRASTRLAVAREGVPVLLGLVWESGAPPPSPGPDAVADGAVLQRALASAWAALAPSQREDDLACLGSVVHAVAHADHAAHGLRALGAGPAAAARVPGQVRRRAVAPG